VLDLDEYVDEVYVRDDGVGLAVVHDRVFAWDPDDVGPLRARAMRTLDPWSAYVVARTCDDPSIDACAARPLPPVDALQTLHNVDLERGFGCGLDDAGRVRCVWYGEPDELARAATFFDIEQSAVQRGELRAIADFKAVFVDVGDGHACAIDEHDVVRCWGNQAGWPQVLGVDPRGEGP
jgi:hypothetical protein